MGRHRNAPQRRNYLRVCRSIRRTLKGTRAGLKLVTRAAYDASTAVKTLNAAIVEVVQ